MERNMVGWFEVPVADMERAIRFYQQVFDIELSRNQMGPLDMAWFPMSDGGFGAMGSLVRYDEFYKPSTDGVLVYFHCQSGDLNNELARIEPAGGKVVVEKTEIAENFGYMAIFIDSEGNRVALHSDS
jgi:uncharacterized protein